MSPVIETILSRRSVRTGFTTASVSVEVLEDIVRCGLSAPSSKNARPWRFHVVRDERLRNELADVMTGAQDVDSYVPFDPLTGKPWPQWSSTVVESAEVVRAAPVAIFVENRGVFSRGRSALLQATPQALAASITGYTLEVMGVGAAIQSMWIAAIARGLAGVFMGDVLIAEEAIRERLAIEGDLAGVLALGYTDPPGKPRSIERTELSPDNLRWLDP